MSAVGFFLGAMALALGATLLAVAVLRRPMADLVAELCGSRERGAFWVTLATVCTVLAATAAATLPAAALLLATADASALLLNAIAQCCFALAGVLVSLFSVAAALLVFIRRFELCSGRTAPAASAGERISSPASLPRVPALPDLRGGPEATLRRLLWRKRQSTQGGSFPCP